SVPPYDAFADQVDEAAAVFGTPPAKRDQRGRPLLARCKRTGAIVPGCELTLRLFAWWRITDRIDTYGRLRAVRHGPRAWFETDHDLPPVDVARVDRPQSVLELEAIVSELAGRPVRLERMREAWRESARRRRSKENTEVLETFLRAYEVDPLTSVRELAARAELTVRQASRAKRMVCDAHYRGTTIASVPNHPLHVPDAVRRIVEERPRWLGS